MVFDCGMRAVVRLYATEPGQAVAAWQVIEPVAEALGSSGGEILGGIWIVPLRGAALRAKVFPVASNWLGVGIGVTGIVSLLPALNGLGVAFGLLQIVWFAWLGTVMLRAGTEGARRSRGAPRVST